MTAKMTLQRVFLLFLVILLAACRPISQEQIGNAPINTPTRTPVNTLVYQTATVLPTTIARAPSPTPTLMGPQPSVLISGFVDHAKGTGEFDSIYMFESMPDIQPPGEYAIRFEDTAGEEIASYAFGTPSGSEGPSDFGAFVLLLPWDADTTRIVLLKNEIELDAREASENKPMVNILYPNGGEALSSSTTKLRWSAVDADDDPLAYVVQFSDDGGTSWQAMAVDLTDTMLEIDADLIPNTELGVIRVLASDGFYTAQDQSDEFFSVSTEKEVYVEIFEDYNEYYGGEQSVLLSGEAYDDFGELREASLVWSSDIDGVLDTGDELFINAMDLSEGTHKISLTAEHKGRIGKATVEIRIYREYSDLSIDPEVLNFVARAGDPATTEQLIEVWHLGNQQLTWSAAADQSWILLIPRPDETPFGLIVSANPAGLAVGTYTGTITITSDAKGVDTRTVTVTLEIVK